VALAALAAIALLATQGCDVSPAAQASAPAHPDMTFAQARTVYQSYLTASDAAAANGDSAAGLSLVSDASWEFARARYTVHASNGTPVQRYVYGTPRYYVPIVSGFPHWFVVDVPRHTADSGDVDTLMVFGQSKPEGTWSLDGEAALQPGQKMPAIATGSGGYAIAMSTYQQGLLVQPNVTGGTQAAVVDEGPQASAAGLVAPGPQTTSLYSEQAAARAATPKDLEYLWYMLGTPYPVFALQTTGGGALVLYGVDLDTVTEHPDATSSTDPAGTPIPIPAAAKPMLATPSEVAGHVLDVYYTYEFAAIDPPASTKNGQLTIIAASRALAYAHAF
jgi:hypothetical protein